MIVLPHHVSDKGVRFIEQWEGFLPNWYRDPVGVETIGFGHTGTLPAGFRAPLTREQGQKLLRHDLTLVELEIMRIVDPPFRMQCRFDAIASFVFNLGPGPLYPNHAMGDALRNPARRGAAAAFLLYDKAGNPPHELPGLTRRRKQEARVFVWGVYGNV